MPDLRDFLPQPPWEGPPVPKGEGDYLALLPEEILARFFEKEKLRYFARWLERHQRLYIRPSGMIISISRGRGWIYSGTVYRGVRWGTYRYKPYDSPYGKFKVGDELSIPKEQVSWTKFIEVAYAFSIFNRFLPFPRETLLKYSESHGYAGIVLEGEITNGLDFDKAEVELGELYGGFPTEGQVYGIVERAKVVDYIDYRLDLRHLD